MKPTDTQMMDYLQSMESKRYTALERELNDVTGKSVPLCSPNEIAWYADDGTEFIRPTFREAVAAAMKHDGVIT